jgi:hypothetical protein
LGEGAHLETASVAVRRSPLAHDEPTTHDLLELYHQNPSRILDTRVRAKSCDNLR